MANYLLIVEIVKVKYLYIIILVSFIGLSSMTQQDDLETIRRAIQTGNTDILFNYSDANLEIITDENSGNYSRNQSKFVLKEFFVDHPATSFNYLHQGSSPAGSKYAVGLYVSPKASFRVSIKFRNDGKRLYIDSIQFTKE